MLSNLLWGYGGENIIGRFSDEFSSKQVPVITVDPMIDEKPPLVDGPVNILTSNHFTRDDKDLKKLYSKLNTQHDFYDVMRLNDIRHMFYFVHDHSEILVLDEPTQLQRFKAVVTPWPSIHRNSSYLNLFCCDMSFKNAQEFYANKPNKKAIWLVSMIEYGVTNFGVDGFTDKIYEFAHPNNVDVKLPVYGDLHEKIGNKLTQMGVNVIDPNEVSAISILKAEYVVATMFSGVAAMATYYGKDVIVVDYMESLTSVRSIHREVGYTEWIANCTVVTTPLELKAALAEKPKIKQADHQCGVFREDFLEYYYNELFTK